MQSAETLLKNVEALFKAAQYKQIVEALPDEVLVQQASASLYGWRARAHNNLMETDMAYRYADQGIGIDANNAFNYEQRGLANFDRRQYAEAVKDFSMAISLASDKEAAYYNRAVALYADGKVDEAMADYEQVLKLNKNNVSAHNNKGYVYYQQRRYEDAIAAYTGALAINPQNSKLYANRGLAYFDRGDYVHSLNDFNKAKELIPEGREVDNSLEYYIRLATEKLDEQEKLGALSAADEHKQIRTLLEQQIGETINSIRAAAKADVQTVVHYTKVFVAEIYVKEGKKPNGQAGQPATPVFAGAKMQYSNAIYMNDPMEGKVFFHYLNEPEIEAAYVNGEKRNETSVYLGSFLPAADKSNTVSHEDELVMWRTYGKDENGKEAAGCSVVLSSDFFKKTVSEKDKMATGDMSSDLLNVIYIKQKKSLANDVAGKTIASNIGILRQLLKKLLKLGKAYPQDSEFYRSIENTVFKELSRISYLFKTADYQFENEVRVITYMPRGSDLVKCREMKEPGKPPKRFFIESENDILPYIKKIYLGPKVEHHQQWSLYFDYEIRQRAKELNGMEQPPYKIEPSQIEIRKSESEFQ
jgi:tetratricopeptide (TPR) repeat protein